MGIRGLYTKISSSDSADHELDKLHNTYLIIDASNVSSKLWTEVSRKSDKLSGNYDLYGWNIKQFFITLKSCNITPIVVLDGLQGYLNGWVYDLKSTGSVIKNANYNPLLLTYVFYNITRSMGIQSLRTTGEADNTIAALAEAYDCPVLSMDNDFYLYGVKYIAYLTLSHQSTRCAGGSFLSCRIYNPDELSKKFNRFNRSLLPLALELLQDQNRASEVFKSFFSIFTADEEIPDTLTWLSQFESLDDAVKEVLKYISDDNKQIVLDKFKERISEFATVPAEILPFLELHDSKIVHLKKRRDEQRVKFQGQPDMPAGHRHTSIREDSTVIGQATKTKRLQFTGEMIIREAPQWWCRDFFTSGITMGIVMKLLIHYLRASRFKRDEQFPPMNEAEIPAITRVSELVISSMENQDYVLNLPIKDRNNEVRLIRLRKFPVHLEDLRISEVDERIHVIHETLGIEDGGNLQKLPENWRLYVATIIYWMKRQCKNEKTNVHLCSLLFTMLFGIIDEKLGFYRRIYNDRAFVKGQFRGRGESEAYNDLNVTKEDCFVAAKFFRPRSTMTDAVFDGRADCETFEANFWEFQRCLQFTLQVNALLNCPYVPSPIQELFNGTLLYNVFIKFSEAQNINTCVEIILENSPGLISVFELLKDIVRKELNESTSKN